MLRKIRKLILHPNRYLYDYFRKKLGFRKGFVNDKITLIDNTNGLKSLGQLFSHPNLYLYRVFNKRLGNPEYPILVDWRIEGLPDDVGGKHMVLVVELERNNILYFADPGLVLKAQSNQEPNLERKAMAFSFQGSDNRVFIGPGVSFGKGCKFLFNGSGNYAHLESGSVFKPEVHINFASNGNYFHAGDKTIMMPGAIFNLGSNSLVYICGYSRINRCNINLSIDTVFLYGFGSSANTNLSCLIKPGSNLLIGSDCMFSNSIDIRTGDSHAIYDAHSKKRINSQQNIVIGDHVWIGHTVSVFKGTLINDGSVIGARSLLPGSNIPAKSIAAGIPAAVVKENILWTRKDPYIEDDMFDHLENTPQAIGLERLTKINNIDVKVSAKEKVELIEQILEV